MTCAKSLHCAGYITENSYLVAISGMQVVQKNDDVHEEFAKLKKKLEEVRLKEDSLVAEAIVASSFAGSLPAEVVAKLKELLEMGRLKADLLLVEALECTRTRWSTDQVPPECRRRCEVAEASLRRAEARSQQMSDKCDALRHQADLKDGEIAHLTGDLSRSRGSELECQSKFDAAEATFRRAESSLQQLTEKYDDLRHRATMKEDEGKHAESSSFAPESGGRRRGHVRSKVGVFSHIQASLEGKTHDKYAHEEQKKHEEGQKVRRHT